MFFVERFCVEWIKKLKFSSPVFLTIPLMMLAFLLFIRPPGLLAQDQSQPAAGSQKQEAPPEAGGPQNDVGPYAIPRKRKNRLRRHPRPSPN